VEMARKSERAVTCRGGNLLHYPTKRQGAIGKGRPEARFLAFILLLSNLGKGAQNRDNRTAELREKSRGKGTLRGVKGHLGKRTKLPIGLSLEGGVYCPPADSWDRSGPVSVRVRLKSKRLFALLTVRLIGEKRDGAGKGGGCC